MPRIVDAAEQPRRSFALDSDVVTAEILAESVQRELSARQAVLESLAESPRLRQLIDDARRLTDAELFDRCDRAARESGTDSPADDPYDWMNGVVRAAQQHLESEGRTVDESWFITDVDGRQIFRLPPKDSGHKTTLGRSFHWRDYYHGLGRELPPETPRDSVSIRTQPGISFPFRSRATEQFMIAIAAPVRGEDGQQVIGVVARTIGLPQLLRQWEVEMHLNGGTVPPRTELHNRFLALADTRGGYASLLDHPWMTHARLENMSDSEIDSPDSPLRIERDMAVTLTSQRKTDRYRDPIGAIDQDFQGDWLAAAAPVGRTGWLAIVQERRDATVRPVDDLRRVFVNAGVWSVAIFSILLGLLWYLLRRAAT
ncbi:MAG: cache domain-containing protein [Planctomycetaceae bacterium]